MKTTIKLQSRPASNRISTQNVETLNSSIQHVLFHWNMYHSCQKLGAIYRKFEWICVDSITLPFWNRFQPIRHSHSDIYFEKDIYCQHINVIYTWQGRCEEEIVGMCFEFWVFWVLSWCVRVSYSFWIMS